MFEMTEHPTVDLARRLLDSFSVWPPGNSRARELEQLARYVDRAAKVIQMARLVAEYADSESLCPLYEALKEFDADDPARRLDELQKRLTGVCRHE